MATRQQIVAPIAKRPTNAGNRAQETRKQATHAVMLGGAWQGRVLARLLRESSWFDRQRPGSNTPRLEQMAQSLGHGACMCGEKTIREGMSDETKSHISPRAGLRFFFMSKRAGGFMETRRTIRRQGPHGTELCRQRQTSHGACGGQHREVPFPGCRQAARRTCSTSNQRA